MKKVISVISRIWLALAVGGIAFAIFRGLGQLVISYLESTGGVVMARDYMEAEILPAMLGICVAGFTWYVSEGLNEE
jgi:hypothetical protein